jgi:hypothetical protein
MTIFITSLRPFGRLSACDGMARVATPADETRIEIDHRAVTANMMDNRDMTAAAPVEHSHGPRDRPGGVAPVQIGLGES